MSTLVTILIMFVSVLGPSIVMAAVGYSSIQSLGRNPSAAPKIFVAMLVALVFAEALGIISLLVMYSIHSGSP